MRPLILPFEWIWSLVLRHQFLRFLCVGGVATLFDWGTFYLINQRIGMHYQAALALAWLVGTLVHYTLNRFFTFRSQCRRVGIQLGTHIGVSILSLGVSALLMYTLIGLLLLHPMLSRMVTTGVMFVFNYFMHKSFTFNDRWIN